MSVADKSLLRRAVELNPDVKFQILPEKTRPCVDSSINSYPKLPSSNILIHASYITRIFNQEAYGFQSKQEFLIKGYIKLARRLGTKYILVHGPSNLAEFRNFSQGLQWLKSVNRTHDPKIFCIEIPAFSKDLHGHGHGKDSGKDSGRGEFITGYLDLIVSMGFQIVLDTAHLHSNGLNAEAISELLVKYSANYDWVHLNGNSRPSFTSDKHTSIISEDSKLLNPELILRTVSKLKKTCVCEIVYKNRSWWESLAEDYRMELVPGIVSENL